MSLKNKIFSYDFLRNILCSSSYSIYNNLEYCRIQWKLLFYHNADESLNYSFSGHIELKKERERGKKIVNYKMKKQ